MGLDVDDVLARKPDIIYARGTGYGPRGPMAGMAGFDFPSAWCRAGAAFAQTPPDGPPPMQPGSIGDLMSGSTLASAVVAALFRRERTGKGAVIDNALFHMGAYLMTQAIASASLGGGSAQRPHGGAPLPLVNLYRSSDGRWLCVTLMYDRWWPDFARRVGREDLLADERFATPEGRLEHGQALIDELRATFATRTFEEWKTALMPMEGVWAPVQSPAEMLDDEQAWANGFLVSIATPDGTTYSAVPTPGQFDREPIGKLRPAPGYGAHSAELLAEVGASPAQIEALRAAGVTV